MYQTITTHKLDVRRLLCPLPVIRLGQTIETVNANEIIELIATDRGVLYDVPAWCGVHGHQVVKTWHHDHEIVMQIKKNQVK